jgi:hypothetical protein
MSPVCISTTALRITGASSTGEPPVYFVKRLRANGD